MRGQFPLILCGTGNGKLILSLLCSLTNIISLYVCNKCLKTVVKKSMHNFKLKTVLKFVILLARLEFSDNNKMKVTSSLFSTYKMVVGYYVPGL